MESGIKIFDSRNIDELDWSNDAQILPFRNYLEQLLKSPINEFISNANGEVALIKVDDCIIPISINEYKNGSTFISSIFSQYISYAIEELDKLDNKFLQAIFSPILKFFGAAMQLADIDKAIHINNWMFPTNICSHLSGSQIKKIRHFLVSKYPKHALIFRTLNYKTNHDLIKYLIENQFQLIGSRQIYLLDKESLSEFKTKKPRDVKKDEDLLKAPNIKIINYTSKSKSIEESIQKMYREVYLEKHSFLNPGYTMDFFELIHKTPGFTIKLIYNEEELIGFIGYMIKDGIAYAPLLGYASEYWKEKGVYRMISALKIKAAEESEAILHSSAGASSFKLNRGHSSEIEYHAIYVKHLGMFRRFIWKILALLVNHLAMPLIKKRGL